MANYTLKIMEIMRNPKNKEILFNFDYPFYLEEHRKEFEDKFLANFIGREIGFATLGEFKAYFQAIMIVNAERFEQYYKIELEASKQNYLYNKDLTIEEELKGDMSQNSTSNSSANSNSETIDNYNSSSNYEESQIGNGLANLKNKDRLTGTSNSKDSMTDNSNTNSNSSQENNGQLSANNTQTILRREYGNIGITTGADLQKSWRDVIQTTDEYIFKYLECLFFGLY